MVGPPSVAPPAQAVEATPTERWLREVIDAMPIFVRVFDRDDVLRIQNRSAMGPQGDLDAESQIGRHRRDVTRQMLDYSGALAGLSEADCRAKIEAWLRRMEPDGYSEDEVRYPDGRVISNRSRRLADGSLVAVHIDITELKKMQGELELRAAELERQIAERIAAERALRSAETRLRDIINALPIGVVTYDRPAGLVSVRNKAMQEIFPADDPATALGMSRRERTFQMFKRLPGNATLPAAVLWRQVDRWIAEGDAAGARPRELKLADGRTLWNKVVTLADGTVISSVVDITDLRMAQEKLADAERMAALGGLVTGVAHEINTPIGIVVTAASHLEEQAARIARQYQAGQMSKGDFEDFIGDTVSTARMLLRNAQRAAELVASFKLVSVDESAEQRQAVSLSLLFRDVLTTLQGQLGDAHAVVIDCPPDIRFESYPRSLAEIVTHLVMNSLIHGFAGGRPGRIEIAARRRSDAIDITYRDDGVGVDPGSLRRLFEPFFTTRRGQGGGGLGLSVVYNLVTQQMGGTIEAGRAPSGGLEFRLRLPVPTDSGVASDGS